MRARVVALCLAPILPLALTSSIAAAQEAPAADAAVVLPAARLPGAMHEGRTLAVLPIEFARVGPLAEPALGLPVAGLELYAAGEEEDDDERQGRGVGTPGLFGLGSGGRAARAAVAAPPARGGWTAATLPGAALLHRAARAEGVARVALVPTLRAEDAREGTLAAARGVGLAAALGADFRPDVPATDAGSRGAAMRLEHASPNAAFLRDDARPAPMPAPLPRIDLPGSVTPTEQEPLPLGDGTGAAAADAPALASPPSATIVESAVTVTPEPASLALLGTGVAALGALVGHRRRR